MFALTKAGEYAILFLAGLAGFKGKKPVKLKIICQKSGLPSKFLSRLVLSLKKAGLIISKKGVKGGYFLAKKPEEISLMEIIRAVEGKKGLVACLHGRCLMEKSCLHKNVWQKLQQQIEKEFGQITLKNLLPE